MPPPQPAVRPLGTFRKRFNSRPLVTFRAGRVWTSAADKVLRRYVSVRIVAIGRPLCETPDAFPWSDGTVGATRCEGTEVLSEIRGAWSDLVQVYKPGACGLRCVAPHPHAAPLHAHSHANARARTHARTHVDITAQVWAHPHAPYARERRYPCFYAQASDGADVMIVRPDQHLAWTFSTALHGHNTAADCESLLASAIQRILAE